MAATITVRRINSDGEPAFGHGADDFISDSAAVAQLIIQTILLLRGQWFESTDLGTPLYQGIFGSALNGANKAAASAILTNIILGVPYVTAVTSLILASNTSTRSTSIQFSVTTQFSSSPISSSVVLSPQTAVLSNE